MLVAAAIALDPYEPVFQTPAAQVVLELVGDETRQRCITLLYLPFIDADWLMERWLRAHQSAGVRRRVGPYPWRHTYISLALSNGAAPLWVSKQTGHDMVTMSKHYARWISGREAEDQRELEKVYKRVNKKD